ncbi:ATP-binding protein [Streptomyces pseudovenezuelae]|uniref:ATP-binding protein n=1 Tax=Streptomyces pseudovenezuelae TaxID=67350 RepID=UPI0024750775|nr:ATP-binding protein [Streptomyces pseudovenezuelae]
MAEHWIAVVGSSPGVGKTTLCGALADWLGQTGAVVDHFEEADVLTRAAFRAVAEEFAGGTGSVQPGTLVEAARSYVEQARADGVDVLVTDALIPFIPSLVAWGHDETAIAQVVHDVADAVAPTRISVVFLRDDPEAALQRAIEREGPRWADWYVDKLGRSSGTAFVSDLPSAIDHLRRESELTLRVLASTGWNVVVVDVGERDAVQTERHVRERLQGWLSAGVR